MLAETDNFKLLEKIYQKKSKNKIKRTSPKRSKKIK